MTPYGGATAYGACGEWRPNDTPITHRAGGGRLWAAMHPHAGAQDQCRCPACGGTLRFESDFLTGIVYECCPCGHAAVLRVVVTLTICGAAYLSDI